MSQSIRGLVLNFKYDFKQLDSTSPQVLRFVLTHTGLKAGLAERFRAILNIFQNGGQISHELIDTRCHRGADIARQMRLSEVVAKGIEYLDEHWDGCGKPTGARGSEIPFNAQIALLAQIVDVFHTASGPDAARAEIRRRTGTWFNPEWAAAFQRVAEEPNFWETLRLPNLTALILQLSPAQNSLAVDENYLDDIAAAFAQVIDSKSSYTGGHSERVTLYADMIAEQMGLSPKHRRWLKRAALLHDVGKLGVSNTILDKPGKLNDEEWIAMRAHAALSESILQRIAAFSELAPIAGAHHEGLDGKGYPRGLRGDEIMLETRILNTADIFDALTAERPYRSAMPISKALVIMADMQHSAIGTECFKALEAAMSAIELRSATPKSEPASESGITLAG